PRPPDRDRPPPRLRLDLTPCFPDSPRRLGWVQAHQPNPNVGDYPRTAAAASRGGSGSDGGRALRRAATCAARRAGTGRSPRRLISAAVATHGAISSREVPRARATWAAVSSDVARDEW